MAGRPDTKPYKVYRQSRSASGRGNIQWDEAGGGSGRPGKRPKRDRRTSWRWRVFRYFRRAVYVGIVLALIWGTVAFLAFNDAVKDSNERVPRSVMNALSATNGPAYATSHYTMVLGTDTSALRAAETDDAMGRTDTILLMHTNPRNRQFTMLSIPRDLRVEIPGHGTDKINAAYQIGGPALTVKTVRQLTGIPIHHYIEVDFDGFEQMIDDIGGITLYNEKPILSAPFDGKEYRFDVGIRELGGKRALAYARVRSNQLDPNENDLTRTARQQAVIDATMDKVLSTYTVRNPRDVPTAMVHPLTTDLTAFEMAAVAFAKIWSTEENTVRCRLGGTADGSTGVSYIIGDEYNAEVVRMFRGQAQPAAPDSVINPFAPGCEVAPTEEQEARFRLQEERREAEIRRKKRERRKHYNELRTERQAIVSGQSQ